MEDLEQLEELEKKVAAYARVSTDSENQDNSFQNQKGYFKKAVDNIPELTFVKLYSDQGLSGVYWKKRDGFNKMLHDAGIDVVKEFDRRSKKEETKYYVSTRKPKFGQIWIKNTARFARNTFSFEIIEKLREKGVYIRFLTQSIYTKDPRNDFVVKLLMDMDENESRLKSEAVRWGYQRGKENGRIYTHPTIIGFDYIKEQNKLIKNKDAEIIKKIFDWYTEEGLGIRRIMNKLREEGIKSPNGKEHWGSTTIKNILKNEKYVGLNNSLKYDHGSFGHKTWAHEKENYDLTETDKIEQIITKEQFDKAQKLKEEKCINNNNKLKGKKISYNKYCKKLVCSKCGANFLHDTDYRDVAKTDKYCFFRCSKKKKYGVKYCDSPNVLEEVLDDLVKDFSYGKINEEIEKRKINYCYLLLKVASMELDEINNDTDEISSVLKNKITEKEKQAETYFLRLIENPELDKHGIFKKMIEEINSELDKLKEEYEQVALYNKNIYDTVEKLLEQYYKIKETKFEAKKRYAEEEVLDMIDSIYVYKSQTHKRKPVLMFSFKFYHEARKLLEPFQDKYKFKIENLEKMKGTEIKEVNTLYNQVTEILTRAIK
jgi:DNA invertase Pin-like site-specific DNA recombinase